MQVIPLQSLGEAAATALLVLNSTHRHASFLRIKLQKKLRGSLKPHQFHCVVTEGLHASCEQM